MHFPYSRSRVCHSWFRAGNLEVTTKKQKIQWQGTNCMMRKSVEFCTYISHVTIHAFILFELHQFGTDLYWHRHQLFSRTACFPGICLHRTNTVFTTLFTSIYIFVNFFTYVLWYEIYVISLDYYLNPIFLDSYIFYRDVVLLIILKII